MKIAICDDEAAEREALAASLERWQAERGLPLNIAAFPDPGPLLDAAARERFSLYLLDVIFPGADGIDTARELRLLDENAAIVFLTASPDFAYRSYSVRAADYLLKPVAPERLFPILDRLAQEEREPQAGLNLKCGSTLVRLPFSELAFVEVNRKRLYFNLAGGQVREVYGPLSAYEPQLLARPEFMRVHRSYIVNLHQVRELSPEGIRTFSDRRVPVSRLLYPQVQRRYVEAVFQ